MSNGTGTVDEQIVHKMREYVMEIFILRNEATNESSTINIGERAY